MRYVVSAFMLLSFISLTWGITAFQQKQPNQEQLQKGKALSKSCTNCHGSIKGVAANPLQRIRRFRSMDWIYRITQNPMKLAAENKQAKGLFAKTYMMPAFPALSKSDIIAILDYFDSLPFDPKNYKHRQKQ